MSMCTILQWNGAKKHIHVSSTCLLKVERNESPLIIILYINLDENELKAVMQPNRRNLLGACSCLSLHVRFERGVQRQQHLISSSLGQELTLPHMSMDFNNIDLLKCVVKTWPIFVKSSCFEKRSSSWGTHNNIKVILCKECSLNYLSPNNKVSYTPKVKINEEYLGWIHQGF